MTPEELAFAAGLMEGEGTVRITAQTRRNKGALAVSCVNTDEELIMWLQARWPGYCKPATGLRLDQKPAFVWCIAARRAQAFLEAIEPYVVSDRMKQRIEMGRAWQALKLVHWQHRDEEWAEESFRNFLLSSHLNERGVG